MLYLLRFMLHSEVACYTDAAVWTETMETAHHRSPVTTSEVYMQVRGVSSTVSVPKKSSSCCMDKMVLAREPLESGYRFVCGQHPGDKSGVVATYINNSSQHAVGTCDQRSYPCQAQGDMQARRPRQDSSQQYYSCPCSSFDRLAKDATRR